MITAGLSTDPNDYSALGNVPMIMFPEKVFLRRPSRNMEVNVVKPKTVMNLMDSVEDNSLDIKCLFARNVDLSDRIDLLLSIQETMRTQALRLQTELEVHKTQSVKGIHELDDRFKMIEVWCELKDTDEDAKWKAMKENMVLVMDMNQQLMKRIITLEESILPTRVSDLEASVTQLQSCL
jgi:hypothetical protein